MPQNQSCSSGIPSYEGSMDNRRAILRDLCPCRNQTTELATWRELFELATSGSLRERDGAIHAIGTLVDKARRNQQYRSILLKFEEELNELLSEPKAARLLLNQFKRKGHGHNRRGSAQRNIRKAKRLFDLTTPLELSAWVNDYFDVPSPKRIEASHNGISRLAKWMRHRVRCQPTRRTKETELAKQAERFLPELATL